ncbi:MAG: aldo/keto reductase [Hyphomicrobiales bacterium]|nr:aldo/keto reductase [Hyphomicrobiales bacterium]
MRFRQLGNSGLQVSVAGLGCNNFGMRLDVEGTRKVVHAALDHGITLFDTADIYGNKGGSETQLGEVLGPRRKDIVLATKFAMPMDEAGRMKGGSRRYIMSAVEASLKRLRTDWIDLYQMHRFDPETPIEETMRALDDLVTAGKVRYVGCSNFSGWQVADAIWTARQTNTVRFVSAQDEYSLVVRDHEKELIPALKHYGVGLLPYFPLACGLLTGKYRRNAPMPAGGRLTLTQRHQDRYMTDANWTVVERLEDFARTRGKGLVDIAIGWLAAKAPVASVISGATSAEQIAANVAAAQWVPSPEDIAEIDRLSAR